MTSTGKQLEALLELARNHVMTDAEREEQRQSWARGQSSHGPRQAVVVPVLDDISIHVLAVCDQVEKLYRQAGDVSAYIAQVRRDYSKETP